MNLKSLSSFDTSITKNAQSAIPHTQSYFILTAATGPIQRKNERGFILGLLGSFELAFQPINTQTADWTKSTQFFENL